MNNDPSKRGFDPDDYRVSVAMGAGKDPYPDFEKKIAEVCSSCHTASCWYGEFLCNDSQHASTEKKTVSELRKLKSEHEENWSDEKMMKVYGEPAPFGFSKD